MKLLALALATLSARAFGTPESDIVTAISADRMMDTVKYLSGATSSIKTRFTPTPGCFAATDWAKSYFESLGYSVTLQSWGTVEGYTAAPNVIARKPGTGYANDIYVVCAHIDSYSNQRWTNAPGADDNASGCAVVMEAALLLKDYPTEYPIEFVLFTGEEQWMLGSTYYVTHPGPRVFRGAINLDMVAYEMTPGTPIVVEVCGSSQTIGNAVHAASLLYNPGRVITRVSDCAGDHGPFGDRGIPNCLVIEGTADDIWGGSNPNYHRTTDTWTYLHPQFMRECAIAALGGLASLANVSNGMISVEMPGYAGNLANVMVEVQRRNPGETTPVATYYLPLSPSGKVEIPDAVPAGTWDIAVKAPGRLRDVAKSVKVPTHAVATFALTPGDANNDNRVDILDLNATLLAFGTAGSAYTDVDGDGLVALGDLNLVLVGFGEQGEP